MHSGPSLSPASEERIAEIFASTKQWGRWGPQDERGALNLLTPERVAYAAATVITGRTVGLGRPLPVTAGIENPNPVLHHMLRAGDIGPQSDGLCFTADFVGVACHGFSISHIDALCHVPVAGHLWNGYPASEVTSQGARRDAITAASAGIVGRGVLLDIPRLHNRPWLEPDEVIEPPDLEAACAAQSLDLRSGDIVLISTGRDQRRSALGPWDPTVALAGLHPECIPWLAAHDLSILGSDGASDPRPIPRHAWRLPVHQCLLTGMGVHLLDNLRLSELSQACADEGRWEFLLTANPLIIGGGTGSPINPIAAF